MTLADAQAQYDAILANMGITRAQYEQRSIEYPSGDARIKELTWLEAKIDQLTDQASGKTSGRCTYASFKRG